MEILREGKYLILSLLYNMNNIESWKQFIQWVFNFELYQEDANMNELVNTISYSAIQDNRLLTKNPVTSLTTPSHSSILFYNIYQILSYLLQQKTELMKSYFERSLGTEMFHVFEKEPDESSD